MRSTGMAVLGLGMTLALLGACRDVGGDLDVSWLHASVYAPDEATYRGSGSFSVDERWDGVIEFTLVSRGLDASDGQRFIFVRHGEGLPAEGAYALAPLAERGGVLIGFTAYYYRDVDGMHEAFTLRSGVLHVTSSTNDRIEGSFEFTGLRYCAGPIVDDFTTEYECGDPNTPDPDAPRIDVVGTFVVVPLQAVGGVAD